jgi:S1-C subfamily serine protease
MVQTKIMRWIACVALAAILSGAFVACTTSATGALPHEMAGSESEAVAKARAEKPASAPTPVPVRASLHLPPLGLVIREMTASERLDHQLDHGVWVVVAVGASAIAGVRENDIILSVDKEPVKAPEEFWILLDRKNWQCTLGLLRQGKQLNVEVGKSA